MVSKKNKSTSSLSFLLISHYATFAEADMLFNYLIEHDAKIITQIKLPLPELPYLKQIELSVHEQGKLKTSKKIPSVISPIWLAYLAQSFQLFFLVFGSKQSYEVLIAQNSLLAFLGIILRTFGKCKKVIFFSHGIDKKRFGNSFLNKTYRLLDTISATRSDFNWFLSKNMIPIRKQQGIKNEKLFWIPSTVPIKTIIRKKTNMSNKIVFLGTIDEKNGAQLLPQIIAFIKGSFPNVILDIMGNGYLFKNLKENVKKLHLENNINLFGHLPYEEFSKKLTNYSIGIAPYEYSETSLTPLSDSLKMRLYLAAGLPVVITKGFWFSDEIEKNKLGFAVKQDIKSFANAILTLLTDKQLNREIRNRALAYSKKLDLTGFYDRGFTIVCRTL